MGDPPMVLQFLASLHCRPSLRTQRISIVVDPARSFDYLLFISFYIVREYSHLSKFQVDLKE